MSRTRLRPVHLRSALPCALAALLAAAPAWARPPQAAGSAVPAPAAPHRSKLAPAAPAPRAPAPHPASPEAAAALATRARPPRRLPARLPRWERVPEAERAGLLAAARALPLEQRLLAVSERFLETPYVHSPLGEGAGSAPDPDPTFRLDAVDCLTFVEQTLALALARSDAEVPPLLERIRYAGRPSYETRNHLMEAQWLPNAVAGGLLEDVTRALGGAHVVATTKELTRVSWQSLSSQELGLPRARQVRGSFPLALLPLEHVMEHAAALPNGTVLLVVREERDFKATRVTHLGFVVQQGGRTWLRHASRDPYHRVVDEDLETFLGRNGRYAKWRVSGVSLYRVRAPTTEGPAQQAARPAP